MKNSIKYLISIILAAVLVYYISTLIDFNSLWKQMLQANYAWIVLSMVVSVFSHISRAYRWNLLLKSDGYSTSLLVSTQAVLVGYLANYAVPRMGEVTRSGIVAARQNIPVSKVLGTVIIERIMDVLVMLGMLAVCFLLEFDRLKNLFWEKFEDKLSVFSKANGLVVYTLAALLISGISIVYLIIRFQHQLRKNTLLDKIFTFLEQMLSGIASIFRLKYVGVFLLHTFLIWFLYFLMAYVIFFALPSTEHLPPVAGFMALALSSLGMSAPVQGGIGAYHLMIAAALALYGIAQTDSLVLATLLHTSQFVTILITGGISLLWLFFTKKEKTKMEA